MSKITISITGHRSLSEEQKRRIRPVIEKTINNIIFTVKERNPNAEFVALSPLAEGADILFARVAVSVGLPLKAILPFEEAEYLKGFTSDSVREEFHELYKLVGERDRILVGHHNAKQTGELFLDMGKRLVESSDFLVAIWNGKTGKGVGGTTDVVTYAIEKKKEILVINPEDELPNINYLHHENYKRNGAQEILDTANTNRLLNFIEEKQKYYDNNAVFYNRKYKKIWTTGFVIGLVEVLAFAIYISFHVAHYLLATIEFLCIVAIIMLVVMGRAKKMHSSYVHYRIVGERLRIKKFFAELGMKIFHVSVSPIYFSLKEKPEYHILDNTIRLINLSAWSNMPFDEKKKRLNDELIQDQYHYHERKMEKFEKKNHLYQKVRHGLFLLVVAAVTLHFLHAANNFLLHQHLQVTAWEPPMFHSHWFEQVIIFICVFIPAAIAAAEALKYLYEWEKIITLSSAMSNYFKDRGKKLANVKTEADLEIFLNGINKDMLIETLDWEKYMHDKNEVPT